MELIWGFCGELVESDEKAGNVVNKSYTSFVRSFEKMFSLLDIVLIVGTMYRIYGDFMTFGRFFGS